MAEENVALRVFQTVVGLVGVCGNGLVCVVIAKVRFMHTLTNAFILNQALIDLLGSLLLLLNSLIPISAPLPPGVRGVLLCKLWVSRFFIWGLFIASTFNLAALTLERYLAIVFPFRYQKLATRKKATAVILVLWIAAFLFCTYSHFIYYYEAGQCKSKLVAHPQALGVAVFAVTYFVPVTIMLIAYVHITIILKKGAVRIQPAPVPAGPGPSTGPAPEGQAESLLRARRNTFKTLLIVSVAFAVCWTPNQIIFFLFNLGVAVDFTSAVYIVSVALVASNGCLNPFIYAIKYKQFRKALKALFGRSRETLQPVSSVSQICA